MIRSSPPAISPPCHPPPPPGPALQWHSRTARDADDHAHNLSRWDQVYNQFSAGRFAGRVTELWLPGLQVFLESANQALHQTCAAWPGSVWFGLPVLGPSAARLDTRAVPDHAILFRPGGCEFELQVPEHCDLYGIVVDAALLHEALGPIAGAESMHPHRGGILQLTPAAHRRCIRLLRQVLGHPPVLDPLAGSPPAAAELRAALLLRLGAALGAGSQAPDEVSCSNYRHRRQIVTQARALVLAQPDERLSIADLCNRLHVSRRALQYCFQEVVGLAPLAYLRILKLNQVRRRLHDPRPADRRVTQIATTWGFEHLGEFSRDYRRLFGERPSDTLRQSRA